MEIDETKLRAAALEQTLLLFEFVAPDCCNHAYTEPYEGRYVLIPATQDNTDAAGVPWDARDAAEAGRSGDLEAMARQLFDRWTDEEVAEHLASFT